MQAGFVQFAPRPGERDRNLALVTELVGGRPFDLLVLPELFATGYAFPDRAAVLTVAEPAADGPTARFLCDLSDGGGTVVAGFPELAEDGRIFNAALVVDSGRVAGCYRKVHLFGFEKELFSPGDGGFPVFDTGCGRIGAMICFDWLFPEAARALALQGARVICHPANLILPWCQDAMITRSLENRVFCITANRTGVEHHPAGRLAFTGRSQVTGPRAERLAAAGPDDETALLVDIDPGQAESKRVTGRNDLFEDRVVAAYEPLWRRNGP